MAPEGQEMETSEQNLHIILRPPATKAATGSRLHHVNAMGRAEHTHAVGPAWLCCGLGPNAGQLQALVHSPAREGWKIPIEGDEHT